VGPTVIVFLGAIILAACVKSDFIDHSLTCHAFLIPLLVHTSDNKPNRRAHSLALHRSVNVAILIKMFSYLEVLCCRRPSMRVRHLLLARFHDLQHMKWDTTKSIFSVHC
jgi:hypothetical protein